MTLNTTQAHGGSDPPRPAPAQGGGRDQELWRRFAEAATPRAFHESWLALQCRMVPGARCALVLLGPADRGPFTPAGVWPNQGVDVNHLVPAAEQALKGRRGFLAEHQSPGGNGDAPRRTAHIAYPVTVLEKVRGAVVLEVAGQTDDGVQAAMRQLHWGTAWLEVMILRSEALAAAETNERLRKVLDSVADTLEHDRFQAAAMAFVTRLATMLECDRVSVGFARRGQVRVRALSHSAEFGERANLTRAIETAMEEAVDQQALIVYPPPAEAIPLVTIGHEALARQYGAGTVCTAPLGSDDASCGALTLEFPPSRIIDTQTIELVRTIAALAGPILNTKRREDRMLAVKAWEKAVRALAGLFGPRHLALKFCGLLLCILAAVLWFSEGTYRVKAPTVLEGLVQRSVCAPFNGYIAEASSRAGDVVRAGDMLCRLDDRDLRLEQAKWKAQREQLLKEHRGAMAEFDLPKVRIMEARVNQAQAELALVEEQLSRSRVTSPFDGVIMSGDLSQSLGAPVERGQVLFEVAPLESYRVIVQVDERDIDDIEVGQHGLLALPSLPDETFELTVSAITPVLTAREGRNFFRVEARIAGVSKRLRPGMEGVGKVEIGQRRLAWIWTHEMIDWARLKLWTWLP
jgi:RND family efflux transporter MFP subunit